VERLGLKNSLELLPKNWLQVTLSHKPTKDRTGGEIGSLLPTIFDVPTPAQRAVAKQVGQVLCAGAPGLLASIYRVDVTALDQVTRSVSVLVEGRTVRERADFSWSFDLEFPKSRFSLP
jgi:hypothetical protein